MRYHALFLSLVWWVPGSLDLHAADAAPAPVKAPSSRGRPWLWKTPEARRVPDVSGSTDIDRFLQDRLQRAGIHPAGPADDRTWLRRVSFVVTGLPPSPEQVRMFLSEPAETRRESAVDRLLASPGFGERWARHWLDLMRYAETRGHEDDYRIPNAWHYRDYLIRAFNSDTGYDRIVAEHVAGDLLPPRPGPAGHNESILATGWAFLGEEVHSPVDIRQDECDRLDNKIDVLTKTFLGLTVSCARCHDHKFDPIRQNDYYALAGVLRGAAYRQARFETEDAHAAAARELQSLRQESAPRVAREWAAALNVAPEQLRALLSSPTLDPESPIGRELKTAAAQPFHPLHTFARLRFPTNAPVPAHPPVWPPNAPAVVIADYTRADSTPWRVDGPGFGPGPALAGSIDPGFPGKPSSAALVDFTSGRRDRFWDSLRLTPGNEGDPGSLAATERAGRILRSPSFKLASGKLQYFIRGRCRVYAAVDSHLMIAGPLHGVLMARFDAGTNPRWMTHDLSAYVGHRLHLEFSPDGDAPLDVFAAVDAAETPSGSPCPLWEPATGVTEPREIADALAKALSEALHLLASNRLHEKPSLAPLTSWTLSNAALLGITLPVPDSLRQWAEAEAQRASTVRWESRTAVAWWDGDGIDEDLLIRGKPTRPSGSVARAVPVAFGKVSLATSQSSGRAELARWLTNPTHPLVARVAVNRAWQHVFGTGIVGTPDNFGELGEAPSHPELLDHLARQFIREDEWSLKKLIRRLVLTDAFARSSRDTDPRASELDANNRLLHRMPVRRLEAESVRDAMLAVSGRLQSGAPNRPVAVHLPDYINGRARPESGPLDGDGRRSIYISIRRNFLPQLLVAFDYPTPFSTVGRRNASNVPAQSLALMNDPFVHAQAALWAQRLLRSLPEAGDADRIAWLFESAFARLPEPRESAACSEALAEFRSLAQARPPVEIWSDLAHSLLTASEFIHIR